MANPTPKRRWGKTRQKEKIHVFDQAHTQQLISSAIKERSKLEQSDTHVDKALKNSDKVDLQHPELLSNSTLVETLTQRRVPIPVYQDGTPSRERLLHLFRKHVTPRPQRSSVSLAGWEGRRESGNNSGRKRERDLMEVDQWPAAQEEEEDVEGRPPLQRKR